MTIFTTRSNYFSTLAVADPHVQHTANFTIEGITDQRKSFISIASEQDALAAAVINKLHTPCVLQTGFSGGLTDRVGDIRNRHFNRLQFLTKATTSDGTPMMEDAIAAARELTYLILKAWINKIYQDAVYDNCNGSFKNIDFSTFSWQMIGPVSDDLYGWELSFTDDAPAADVIDYDDAYWS